MDSPLFDFRSAQPQSFDPNATLVTIMHQLADMYLQLHDKRRSEAFGKAALAIKQYPYPIASGKQAMSLPGIGKSTADIIDEYLQSGKVSRLSELQQQLSSGTANLPGSVAEPSQPIDPEKQKILDMFQTVHTIGPERAKNFYDEGYRTLAQLYANPNITEVQRLAIYWNNQLTQRVLRSEIDQIAQLFGQRFGQYGIVWNITGSYRRGAQTSGDIDLLVQEQEGLNMAGVVYLIQDKLVGRFSEGPTKFMGIIKMGEQFNAHQIDIRLVKKAAYPAALMYFTGSKRFNILMRTQAQMHQMSLNEYGLTSNVMGQPDPVVHSEEEIFQLLGVQYLAPRERHDELLVLPLL